MSLPGSLKVWARTRPDLAGGGEFLLKLDLPRSCSLPTGFHN